MCDPTASYNIPRNSDELFVLVMVGWLWMTGQQAARLKALRSHEASRTARTANSPVLQSTLTYTPRSRQHITGTPYQSPHSTPPTPPHSRPLSYLFPRIIMLQGGKHRTTIKKSWEADPRNEEKQIVAASNICNAYHGLGANNPKTLGV